MMKIGLTSYSLNDDITNGRKNILDALRFAAEIGAAHIELVPFGFTLYDDQVGEFNTPLIAELRALSARLSLPLSNYAVLANLISEDENERSAEVERLKRHIDVAHQLGIRMMRHDISSFRRPLEQNTPLAFEKVFPWAVACTQELADYAAHFGITTLVENHGFFFNGSDRMIRLVDAVNRPNFGLLLDTGNFMCVDEDPVVAVKKCVNLAKMVHLKDFYIRKTERLTGVGGLFRCDAGNWFSTNSGTYMLRGSILAQGDLDIWEILRILKGASYAGFVSVEFEGMEPGEIGSDYGISAARYMLDRV